MAARTQSATVTVATTPATAAPSAPQSPAAPVTLKNYIAVVLDRSGSMGAIRQAAINVYNGIADTIRQQAKATGQETKVSLIVFANRAEHVFLNQDTGQLTALKPENYQPNGSTALFDGVGLAIDTFKQVPDADNPNVSFLVVAITDGEENNSQKYFRDSTGKCTKLTKLMLDVQRTDRWSLVFQLPPGTQKWFASTFGIPTDNIREWEATAKGAQTAGAAVQAGMAGFYQARAAGQKSVQKFFVTTDLSRVSAADIKRKLVDISGNFKTYTVVKEVAVKEFVEEKTKKPYVIGSAYYQLMKPEDVQPQKAVLIMEKGKKAIWGGPEARQLIGLQDGVKAKVKPGNHANYDIFVQSTSVNRKLPRGTVVLVDTTKKKDDTPTWDHTSVNAAAGSVNAATP